MFKYEGKEYNSKAEIVRDLYDDGTLTLDAKSKKDYADLLQMTVQTVHATLMKHIGKVGGPRPEKVKKITPAVVQATNRLNQKIAKVRSTNGAIFINDKSDEVREELMKDKKKIAILDAPNQWDMPVCDPPLYVIDENYDPDWKPEPEELIEKAW